MRSQMGYAHPEVLVDTQWVENHMNDAEVRIAEVDYFRYFIAVLGYSRQDKVYPHFLR